MNSPHAPSVEHFTLGIVPQGSPPNSRPPPGSGPFMLETIDPGESVTLKSNPNCDLSTVVPPSRVFHDPLSTLAYGTDVSFYRLIPKIVVRVENEDEVRAVLRAARLRGTPLTFRAAGTSLSGQAISDSVLVVLGRSWTRHVIHGDGERISLQPGIVGGHANALLAPFSRKIGPDPASINAAMIGGIAANNASGMCCGTAQNSYRTVSSMRVIFADRTTLDTGDAGSRDLFLRTRPGHARSPSSEARRFRSAPAAPGRRTRPRHSTRQSPQRSRLSIAPARA